MDHRQLGLDDSLIEAVKAVTEKDMHPNQEKLDKNKNGKLDKDDFKILRGEKVKEETELDESGKVYDPITKKMVTRKSAKVKMGGGATRNGVPVAGSTTPVKEETELDEEQLDEREESPTKGTRKVASYGDHSHTAEVRYSPEWEEYSVHHYKNGKHLGEGPVSYHGDDKGDAHSTAKHSVSVKEEVELDEVDMGQADRTLRTNSSSTNKAKIYHVKDKENKIISTHDNHNSAIRAVMRDLDNYKIVKEETELDEEQLDEANKENWWKTYNKNEDRNARSHNIVHVAKLVGDENDKKEAKSILDAHLSKGHLTSDLSDRRDALHKKLMPKVNQHFKMSEETELDEEQLDELSKKTLGSYVKKVALSQHYDNKNFNSKETNNKDTQSNDEKVAGVKKSSKRTMGVMNAINKLTKEEVELTQEQIAEIEALATKYGIDKE